MALRDLEVFHAIMKAGSLSGAARQLGLSQPAISIALRHFEDRLGFQLFDRVGGRLHPTEEAQAILPDVANIFDRLNTVDRTLSNFSQANAGSVVVAVNASFVSGEMPEIISKFRLSLPATRIVIDKLTSSEVVARVSQRVADFGIAHAPIRDRALVAEPLNHSHVVCMLRRDDPLAAKEAITPADLKDRRIITYGDGTVIGAPIFQAFAEAGVTLEQSIVVNEANLAGLLVQETGDVGLGIRVRHMEKANPELAVRPLHPRIPVVAMLLTSPGRTLSRPARSLIRAIRETVAQMV